MTSKDVQENVSIQWYAGGVIVARALVNTVLHDPDVFAETAEVARHAELLATRLRLPPIDVHKIIIASWLTAFAERPELAETLVRDCHLEDILGSPDLPAGMDRLSVGADVLNLVLAHRALKEEHPDIERNLDATRAGLREMWAKTPEQQAILAKFMTILRDEAFLFDLQAPAAKILIVDPAEVVSATLTLPLMGRGYQVLAVGNVPEAEQVFPQETPDLILAAREMLLEDGIALCKKVRARPELQRTPFVMLTSSKSQRVERECVKAGADDVIVQPVDFELLFLKLQKLLAARPAPLAPAAPAPAGGGVTGSLKEMVLTDVIQILCGGRKSTKVILTHDGKEGTIYIQAGEIIEARVADVQGPAAFYKLMNWKEGAFVAQACTDFPPRTITAPAMSLLMEGARLSDEGTA
ncbi:MAG: response regulator [Verrucomicrobiota bacterium]